MVYVYTNLLGSFVFDEKFKVIGEKRFKSAFDFLEKEKYEKDLLKKHKKAELAKGGALKNILAYFKDKKYAKEFYQRNLQLTRLKVKESVNEDNLIFQTIANINDLDKTNNLLVKRLRDWYNLYLPELDNAIGDHETFVNLVLKKDKKALLKSLAIKAEDSMGADLKKRDIDEMIMLAKQVEGLYKMRKTHTEYLEAIMKKYCPNFLDVAGVTIGAKLFEHAKSLKHLALLPSSTIQLLGAEKALFRHMKTGAPSPKYGVLFTHPKVQGARRNKQGMMARVVASKLIIAAKVDFFRGDYLADKLNKEIEEKFKTVSRK